MPRPPENLDGQRFHRLTVIGITDKRNNYGRLLYRCRCDCGEEALATAYNLKRGEAKECRTCRVSRQSKDITGKRYGRLVAIERGEAPTEQRSTWKWRCRCDCGKTVLVDVNSLETGKTISCGCAQIEAVKSFYVDGTAPMKLRESAKPRESNTSGVTGVWWDASRNKWAAEIMFQGKKHYLGRFPSREEAAEARKMAEDRIFGEYLEAYAKQNADEDD